MRLGISKNLKHSTAEEWAKKHSELGLKAVVFPLDHGDDIQKVREYRNAAEKYDLAVAEVGVWRSLMCADPIKRAENIEYAVESLKFADAIGARCCVDFIGTYDGVRTEDSEKNYTEEAFEAAVAIVREIITRAAPKKTKFVLEAMRNMTPHSPTQYLKFYDAVGMPEFGVHLDPFNWIKTPEELKNSASVVNSAFDLLGDKIVSCHMKDLICCDGKPVECMPCTGGFNNGEYVRRLGEYPDMTVIIEHLQSTEEYLTAVGLFKEKFGI